MKRLRYQVAMSLDGFIAGPLGEFDWIPHDPEIDFAATATQFDTAVMGRKTFEASLAMGGDATMPGIDVVVCSTSLRDGDYPGVRIEATDPVRAVRELKDRPGKDIWLFGGGILFRSLHEARLVDTVEIAVVPVLVGGGVPMMPAPAPRTSLVLRSHRVYAASGIVMLEYDVRRG